MKCVQLIDVPALLAFDVNERFVPGEGIWLVSSRFQGRFAGVVEGPIGCRELAIRELTCHSDDSAIVRQCGEEFVDTRLGHLHWALLGSVGTVTRGTWLYAYARDANGNLVPVCVLWHPEHGAFVDSPVMIVRYARAHVLVHR